MSSEQCARNDCNDTAAARLSSDFTERIGWLRDLHASDSAHDYILCARHAERLTLPVNWVMYDERSARPPAGAETPQATQAQVDPEPPGSDQLPLDVDAGDDRPALSSAFRQALPHSRG
ncbi:MAG TPA: DUF3499 family protein [Acidimicrobiales bacterium]